MCVLQPWVCYLTFMQQSVLITAIRGADTMHKNHVSKKLQRWLRRCVLYSAFDRRILETPYEKGGGSFTGPSYDAATGGGIPIRSVERSKAVPADIYDDRFPDSPYVTIIDHENYRLINGVWYRSDWQRSMNEILADYMRTLDEVPHHFQLHFIHAAEILGYKHPVLGTRAWWYHAYVDLVNDMHLNPETEEQMDSRLGDNEEAWRDAEVVTAD